MRPWVDALVIVGAMVIAMVIAVVLWMVGIPSAIFWWADRKGRQE